MLPECFGTDAVTVRACGNSLIAAGHLRGMIVGEFNKSELDTHDDRFAVEVCGRAVRQ